MPKTVINLPNGGYKIINKEGNEKSYISYNSDNKYHGTCLVQREEGNGIHKDESTYENGNKIGPAVKYLNENLIEVTHFIEGKECGRKTAFDRDEKTSEIFVWNGEECSENQFDYAFKQWSSKQKRTVEEITTLFKGAKRPVTPHPFAGYC